MITLITIFFILLNRGLSQNSGRAKGPRHRKAIIKQGVLKYHLLYCFIPKSLRNTYILLLLPIFLRHNKDIFSYPLVSRGFFYWIRYLFLFVCIFTTRTKRDCNFNSTTFSNLNGGTSGNKKVYWN